MFVGPLDKCPLGPSVKTALGGPTNAVTKAVVCVVLSVHIKVHLQLI